MNGQAIARRFYTRIGEDSYGPKATNPVYTIIDPATGIVWKVTRKHWILPGNSWGYEAKPLPGAPLTPVASKYYDTRYGDTLEEMAQVFDIYTEEQ